jgi:hypothetical protein
VQPHAEHNKEARHDSYEDMGMSRSRQHYHPNIPLKFGISWVPNLSIIGQKQEYLSLADVHHSGKEWKLIGQGICTDSG